MSVQRTARLLHYCSGDISQIINSNHIIPGFCKAVKAPIKPRSFQTVLHTPTAPGAVRL